jgi:hypothetical protein
MSRRPRSCSRPLGERWPHPLNAHARKQRGVLATCEAPSSKPYLPFWSSPTKERARCSFPSHLRTPESGHRVVGLLSPSRRPSRIRLVPAPPQALFRLKPILFRSLLMGGSLRVLPATLSRKWRLSLTVAAGLVLMSSWRSFLVAPSAMGGLPPPFLGLRDYPRSASLV